MKTFNFKDTGTFNGLKWAVKTTAVDAAGRLVLVAEVSTGSEYLPTDTFLRDAFVLTLAPEGDPRGFMLVVADEPPVIMQRPGEPFIVFDTYADSPAEYRDMLKAAATRFARAAAAYYIES